jgi:hypothetical protein
MTNEDEYLPRNHRIKIHTEGPLTVGSFEVSVLAEGRITHVGRHFPSQSMTFYGQ